MRNLDISRLSDRDLECALIRAKKLISPNQPRPVQRMAAQLHEAIIKEMATRIAKLYREMAQ